MAKTRVFRYTITTKLHPVVPFDMLRYDSAWPCSQDDASNLAEMASPYLAPTDPRPTSVTLASHHAPTVARWASFGWHVSDIREL